MYNKVLTSLNTGDYHIDNSIIYTNLSRGDAILFIDSLIHSVEYCLDFNKSNINNSKRMSIRYLDVLETLCRNDQFIPHYRRVCQYDNQQMLINTNSGCHSIIYKNNIKQNYHSAQKQMCFPTLIQWIEWIYNEINGINDIGQTINH